MATGWIQPAIDEIEKDHQDLVWAASVNTALIDDLNECNGDVLFDESWFITKGRLEYLCFFCGIVSVLTGTAQVESNFSDRKFWEEKFQTAVTHISQFSMISSL